MRSCWFGYSRQRLGLQCLWQCRDCLHRRASLHLGVDLSTQFLPLVPDPFEGALLPKLRCINSLLGPYWITSSADAVQLWYHLLINTTSKIYVLPPRRGTKLYIAKLKDRSKKHIGSHRDKRLTHFASRDWSIVSWVSDCNSDKHYNGRFSL